MTKNDIQPRPNDIKLHINSAGLMWFCKTIKNGNTTNWLRSPDVHLYHREGGPATISPTGYIEYLKDDGYYRIDGPAIIKSNGSKEYYIDSREVSPDEYFLKYGVL